MDFLAFGVPMGFDMMRGASESQSRYLGSFYSPNSGTKMRISKLPSGDVLYTYLVYPKKEERFSNANGRNGAFFGMSLILQNQQCKDVKKIYDLFESFYEKTIKNNILKEDEKGNRSFLISRLSSKNVEDFLTKSFQNAILTNFDFRKDIVPFKFNKKESGVYKVNVLDANALIEKQMNGPYDIELSHATPRLQNTKVLNNQGR